VHHLFEAPGRDKLWHLVDNNDRSLPTPSKRDLNHSHLIRLGYVAWLDYSRASCIFYTVTLTLTVQCLIPLANTPLIEYTFEFLANAGVEEVFLYGGAHSDKLEKYIKCVDRHRHRGLGSAPK
jgi:hypothetical protein